jgi:quercetin 2,3-dioxygenase
MITVRKSEERGHFDHGWLDTYHTFSFGDYQDPRHMGFRALRVINEDFVKPGEGFGTHPHRDMEILTWILVGELEHKDSMGNGSVIRPGEAQRMTAGTGVTHSEFNPSRENSVHLLQIWILPEAKNLAPGYEQRNFSPEERKNRLRLIASRDGRDGSVVMHQDSSVFAALLDAGQSVEHVPAPGRYAWIQVARGGVGVNGVALAAGDGAAASGESSLRIEAAKDSEILLFDLG